MRRRAMSLVASVLMVAAGASCSDDDQDRTTDAAAGDSRKQILDGEPASLKDSTPAGEGSVKPDTAPPQPADGGGSGLRWYRTCGDPVCRPAPADAGAGANSCSGDQKEGAPCTEKAASCELVDACGARLLCTDTAPDLTNCPISRKRHKRDIRYVDDAERRRLLSALLELRLAHYQLKSAPADRRPKLGFIIDDKPPGVTVHPDGETVDLYGFTSLVAAAVQAQAREIASLRRELKRLRHARCR